MKSKGKVVLALALAVIVGVAMTLAYAATKMPEKPIVIDSKGIWKKKRKSPVTFDHTKHKQFKCTECHHEYKDGKNVWKEGQEVKKCDQCHKLKKHGDVIKLEKAYHKRCRNCHRKLAKKLGKKKSGPTSCKGCHPKKKK